MRYPIRRSNSRLSFAFQEPTHPCSPNIQSTFDFADAIDIWLGRMQRKLRARCGRKSKVGVRASSPAIADPATRFSPFHLPNTERKIAGISHLHRTLSGAFMTLLGRRAPTRMFRPRLP